MKQFLRLGALFLALCVALTGCGARQNADLTPTDPLTGEELLWPGQRVAAVTIDNASGNTTQWGISSASVVMEALTEEDADTSLCLVYPAVSAMPRVGPVSAGRDLYWRLLAPQQVLPVQLGAGRYTENYLDYYDLRAVDALETGLNAFSCADTWSSNPLWYTSGEAVSAVLESLGISSQLEELTVTETGAESTADSAAELPEALLPALLPQSVEKHLPEAVSTAAARARITFDAANATGFVYNEESGTYQMLHADGSAQIDANNGRQAAFDNLLILFSASSLRDDGRTLDYDLTMGGGLWLHGGSVWSITWAQGTDTTIALYDADGEELHIAQGQTYIALISSVTGQEISITDADGVSVFG